MELNSILKPCYERKVFWVHGQLITFEFGEYKLGNAAGEVTATWLIAMYVWHQTDANGNTTGTSHYVLHQVNSRAEGQQLFEAATEEGAAAWLQAEQQWKRGLEGAGFFAWLRTQCKRQILHRLWQLRQWKRRKEADA